MRGRSNRLLLNTTGRGGTDGLVRRALPGARGVRISRGNGTAGAPGKPEVVHVEHGHNRYRHQRVWHGNQPARHTLGFALQPARQRGGVLPRGRARGPRRKGSGLRALFHPARPAHARVLHRQDGGEQPASERQRCPTFAGSGAQKTGADGALCRVAWLPAKADHGVFRSVEGDYELRLRCLQQIGATRFQTAAIALPKAARHQCERELCAGIRAEKPGADESDGSRAGRDPARKVVEVDLGEAKTRAIAGRARRKFAGTI